MRPHHFYPRMPHGQGFQHFPNQMHSFQPPFPRQMPPGRMPTPQGRMPQGFPTPNPQATGQGTGTFMETASRLLSTAQSFQPLIQQATPLIQQATPMIRNLPALWKLYKGFQSAPDANNEDGYDLDEKPFYESSSSFEFTQRDERSEERQNFSDVDRRHQERPRSTSNERENTKPVRKEPKPSLPRIYQPPYNFD